MKVPSVETADSTQDEFWFPGNEANDPNAKSSMLVTAVVSNPRTMNTLSAVTYYDIACE
jgi:hypothetical protein